MIFRTCPTCGGEKAIYCVPCHGTGKVYVGKGGIMYVDCDCGDGTLPCPTCTDSEGKVTGRGGFLSVEELHKIFEGIDSLGGHTHYSNAREPTATERRMMDACNAELIHRQGKGGG